MMERNAPAVGMIAMLCILAVGCCTPQVARFEATPLHVTPGGLTTLHWDVSGSAILSSTPPSNHDGPIASTGELSVTITEPTTFRIDVSRCGKVTYREQSIGVEGGTPSCCTADPGTMSCEPGGVVATLMLHEKDWGSLRVGRVRGRTLALTVEHAGKSSEVNPGAPSDAFQGTPYTGLWRFHYKKPEGAPCPAPENASLVLEVDVEPESAH
jgi:hypothetical protein